MLHCYTNLPKSSCKVMTYFFCSYLPTPFYVAIWRGFPSCKKTRGSKLKDINSPWASTADGWGTFLFSKPMRQSDGLSSPVKLRDWRMKCIHFSLISHFRTEFCLYMYIHIYEQFIFIYNIIHFFWLRHKTTISTHMSHPHPRHPMFQDAFKKHRLADRPANQMSSFTYRITGFGNITCK